MLCRFQVFPRCEVVFGDDPDSYDGEWQASRPVPGRVRGMGMGMGMEKASHQRRRRL